MSRKIIIRESDVVDAVGSAVVEVSDLDNVTVQVALETAGGDATVKAEKSLNGSGWSQFGADVAYEDGDPATGVLTLAGNATNAKATGVLTFGANAGEDETVTIGVTVYTFKASPAAPYDVDIGATASDSLDNLIAAITGGAGEGTLYGTGTEAHPDVTATPGAGDTMDVEALVAGSAGNAIATTTDVTSASWGAATLEGGTTETVTVGSKVYTWAAALSAPAVANEVLIGATASDSIDHLVAAINGDAGEGTLYGTGTTASTEVTAAPGAGDTMDVTAIANDTSGNALDTLDTMAAGSWGAATLEGGVDPSGLQSGAPVERPMVATGGKPTVAKQVRIRVTTKTGACAFKAIVTGRQVAGYAA